MSHPLTTTLVECIERIFETRCYKSQSQFIFSKLKRTASQFIEGSPTLNDLQKQWRKKKVSLYSSSPVKKSIGNYRTAEMLPLYVVLLTFGAGLFTLIVLNNALNKHGRPSTAFIKAPEKVKIDELVDEYGNPLGGKKAAIQFYHNLNNPPVLEAKPDDPDPELVRVMKQAQPEVQEVKGDDPDPDELVRITNKDEPSEELVKKLTLQLTHNIAEMQKEMLEQEAAKKKLLDKLSQSGHFGTTFHKPEVEKPEKKEIENIVPEVKLLVKREANQPLPAMSPKENPFRISDTTLVKADEEFRFLPEQ